VLAGEGDVERGGDVLVDAAAGIGMARPRSLSLWSERTKRMNGPCPLGRAGGQFSERARQTRLAVGGLLGLQAAGDAVVVLGVVEALERSAG